MPTANMYKEGITWWKSGNPLTYLGDIDWDNYKLDIDFCLPDTGMVAIYGRIDNPKEIPPISGYCFELIANGHWKLKSGDSKILASGEIGKIMNRWEKVSIEYNKNNIRLYFNEKLLADQSDSTFSHGIIALSTGWNPAFFDNINITPVKQ